MVECKRKKTHSALFILFASVALLSFSALGASPFSDEKTLNAESYTVQPGRGPFQYAHLFNIEQDQEGQKALVLLFRARTSVSLRLKKPLQLTGFTSSINLRIEGFRGGETIYALFADRSGRIRRIALGRSDRYDFQDFHVDLRTTLIQRPQRLSEQAYVEFLGWSIEPDLRQVERSTYLILRQPVFDLRPYDMRIEDEERL